LVPLAHHEGQESKLRAGACGTGWHSQHRRNSRRAGTYYHPDDENQDTHNGYCRTDQSVVVQVIDVCPHNHSNNPYWCTDQRANHIDISCSAFTEITNARQDIDNIGSLNVWVRQVDCSVGLGVKQITH
jgi:hypothetical protein